jgi:hypothetical protein
MRAVCPARGGARFQQVGQDFVAQQLGLVRTVQDIGMPCQRRNVVHQRRQMRANIKAKNKSDHIRAGYNILTAAAARVFSRRHVCRSFGHF